MSQVVDVAIVEMSVFELVDNGKKETNGADRHEGDGIISAEYASGGNEKQGGLNAKEGMFLSLESGDDEAVIGARTFRRVGQLLVKRENRTNVE